LEQNYRSTNTILSAANHVIQNNRDRKEKNLWSQLGEGEPVRVLEVEDEHAEARLVAAAIAELVEEAYAGSAIAVVYRTNAQSRAEEAAVGPAPLRAGKELVAILESRQSAAQEHDVPALIEQVLERSG